MSETRIDLPHITVKLNERDGTCTVQWYRYFETSVDAVITNLLLKVDKTTQIIAGYHLSGTGTLAGDITLDVEPFAAFEVTYDNAISGLVADDVQEAIDEVLSLVPEAASTTEQLTGTDASKYTTPDSVAALWEKAADIASASPLALGEGGYFKVTGVVGIADIDFSVDKAGRWAWLQFGGILTLTHSATLVLPKAGSNITTAAGDTALFISEGSDVVRCVVYQKADGTALVASASYTDENAQDAIGGIVDAGIIYDDTTPKLSVVRLPQIQVTDPNGSAITVSDGKAYFRIGTILNGYNLTAVAGALITESSSGVPTIQIARVRAGVAVDMLSTKLTIDAGEKDSSTAAVAAVIDTANDDVATADMLRFDVDVAGTGAKGLIVELTFSRP